MGKTIITRHMMRVRTVLALYAALLLESAKIDFDAKELLDGAYELDGRTDGLNSIPPVTWEGLDPEFRACAVKALVNQNEIAQAISEYLDGWAFDRLPLVTRAIMLVAYTESVLVKSAPKQVAINEALVILKQFGSESEVRYVNAVLEQVISKALNVPTDYKGPGKVHVDLKDLEPDRQYIQSILDGEAAEVQSEAEEESAKKE